MICPKTFKPCCDDLCGGGNCFLLPGVSTLSRCSACGSVYSHDGDIECECPPTCEADDYQPYEDVP